MLEQLHERQTRQFAQKTQIVRIERLDEHRRAWLGIPMPVERIQDREFLRQANAGEVRRMLGLRIDPNGRTVAALAVGGRRKFHDFIEGRHGKASVESGIPWSQCRQALACMQRLDFREREILGKPTRHRLAVDDLSAPPVRELRVFSDIGRAADFVLVARKQHAVSAHDEVRLDVVRALLDRETIRLQSVFGTLAAGASMGYDGHTIQLAPIRMSGNTGRYELLV
jgi:hypothetical protein